MHFTTVCIIQPFHAAVNICVGSCNCRYLFNVRLNLSAGGMLVVSVSVAGLVTLAAMTQPALAPEAKHTLLQYVTGKYLLPSNCRVHFEWDEPQVVGETMTFTVKVGTICFFI